MNVLSLCSGGAGLEFGIHLAADRLGLPAPSVVAYCEREAAALNVLAARMEDGSLECAPVWFDLRTLDGRALAGRVDLVTAGYPCQPDSLAGNRQGASDERWLWHEVWRVVREVGPRYLFVENVPGHLSGTFGRVLGDLAAGGWAAEWDCVPAAAVGAPHLRDRVFCLAADPDRTGLRDESIAERGGGDAAEPRNDGQDGRASPDAQGVGLEGRDRRPREDERNEPRHAGEPLADPSRLGFEPVRGLQLRGVGQEAWEVHHGVPEPVVRGVDDGVADRLDRLYVLGNGVVPQAAAEAFVTLWNRLHHACTPPTRDAEGG